MPVHDVDMNPIGARRFGLLDGGSEP
jgi:hypothetical protein